MLNESYLIRASLKSTRAELAEVFPHLTDDILDWSPTPGMRTIKGQIVEILGTEESIVARLMGKPRRPFSEVEADFVVLERTSDFIGKLAEVRAVTLCFLDSLSCEQLDLPVDLPDDYRSYLDLDVVPVSEMLRFLVRHESYHTGQLVSYLWARGNDPYTWD